MSHPDDDVVARIHRTFLPTIACLSQDGAAVVLCLSASSDFHDRLIILRLPPRQQFAIPCQC